MTTARIGVDIRGAAPAIAAAALGALFVIDRRERTSFVSDMAPGRDVNAQECTRPIERPTANLLCK